jgi:hypothetical protein
MTATKYATEIAETLADLEEDGGPIVFTAKSAGRDYNEDTGLWVEGADVVARSFALQLEDDPAMFAALGLTLRSPITLMVAAGGLAFAPAPLYGTVPVRGNFAGVDFAVKACEPFAPDGTPIYFTVIGDR